MTTTTTTTKYPFDDNWKRPAWKRSGPPNQYRGRWTVERSGRGWRVFDEHTGQWSYTLHDTMYATRIACQIAHAPHDNPGRTLA